MSNDSARRSCGRKRDRLGCILILDKTIYFLVVERDVFEEDEGSLCGSKYNISMNLSLYC